MNIKFSNTWIDFYDKIPLTDKIKKRNLHGFDFINWKIFTINDLIERQHEWINELWVDVAVKYCGMSVYHIMAILKNDHNKCFFRTAGGASGIEQITNYQMFINHDPYTQPDKLYTIEQGIEFIKNEQFAVHAHLQKGDESKVKL